MFCRITLNGKGNELLGLGRPGVFTGEDRSGVGGAYIAEGI